jgi:ATP phosphoribosyltransferase
MEITVNPKAIKLAAAEMVMSTIDSYSLRAVERSGVDAKAVVKAMSEEPKFLKQLAKRLSEMIDDALLQDVMWNCFSTELDKAEKLLMSAQKDVDKLEEAELRAQRKDEAKAELDRKIKELEALGYKVTKK